MYSSIPVYFIWLKYLSWFLHGNEALSVNQWKGVQNITCRPEGGCIESGDQVLEQLSFKEVCHIYRIYSVKNYLKSKIILCIGKL
jgi:hypothetical protein